MDNRGRLTIPDLVYVLMSLAYIGALYPVFVAGYEDNLSEIIPGAALLFQLILPISILVLLTVVWVKTIGR